MATNAPTTVTTQYEVTPPDQGGTNMASAAVGTPGTVSSGQSGGAAPAQLLSITSDITNTIPGLTGLSSSLGSLGTYFGDIANPEKFLEDATGHSATGLFDVGIGIALVLVGMILVLVDLYGKADQSAPAKAIESDAKTGAEIAA
jgi:hypothetical protein